MVVDEKEKQKEAERDGEEEEEEGISSSERERIHLEKSNILLLGPTGSGKLVYTCSQTIMCIVHRKSI